MRHLRDRPEHLMAAGLLAANSAIAFNDAGLRVFFEIAPERFRVDPKKVTAIDKLLEKAKPDMEVRI